MKFVFDIDEQRINEAIVKTMVEETVEQIERGMFGENGYGQLRKLYKENVQAEVRAMIKAHETEIVEKAITEAGAIVARKAWAIKAGEIV